MNHDRYDYEKKLIRRSIGNKSILTSNKCIIESKEIAGFVWQLESYTAISSLCPFGCTRQPRRRSNILNKYHEESKDLMIGRSGVSAISISSEEFSVNWSLFSVIYVFASVVCCAWHLNPT